MIADFLGIAGLLGQILCWIKQLGALVLSALVDGLNAAITALAAAVAYVVGVFPSFPDPPDWLTSGAADASGFVSWLLPLGFMLSWLGVLAGLWATSYVLMAVLRWAKAVKA